MLENKYNMLLNAATVNLCVRVFVCVIKDQKGRQRKRQVNVGKNNFWESQIIEMRDRESFLAKVHSGNEPLMEANWKYSTWIFIESSVFSGLKYKRFIGFDIFFVCSLSLFLIRFHFSCSFRQFSTKFFFILIGIAFHFVCIVYIFSLLAFALKIENFSVKEKKKKQFFSVGCDAVKHEWAQ